MSTANGSPPISAPSRGLRNIKNRMRKSWPRSSPHWLNPRTALAAAAVFHVVVTLSVFIVGRLGLYRAQINSDGIAQFARDGYRFKSEIELLAGTLVHDGLVAWLASPLQIHIKLYSLSFALLGRLLGSNILIAEPLNLFCYLAILAATFKLSSRIAGIREAWLASIIVALWPTFLLHTTQFLREPLLITAILILVLALTDLITRVSTWSKNLIAGVLAGTASLVLWMSRPDMWPVIKAIVLLGLVLLVFRMVRDKKLLLSNLAVVVLLVVLTGFMPQMAHQLSGPMGLSLGSSARGEGLPLAARIMLRRLDFIAEDMDHAGSTIDPDVRFENGADIVRYLPRALEIGYFAPFPVMWLKTGYNVGLMGRLIAGVETLLTYVIELLACIFVWQNWRRLSVWFFVLTITTGVTALSLVVVNVGTLYRMRYSFWILMVVLATPVITRLIASSEGILLRPVTNPGGNPANAS